MKRGLWFMAMCLLLGAPALGAAAPTEPATGGLGWLRIERATEGFQVPGLIALQLNGAEVGVIADQASREAALQLKPASDKEPHTLRLTTLDTAYSFTLRLAVDEKGVRIIGRPTTETCAAVTLTAPPAVLPRTGALSRLRLSFARSGDISNCKATPRAFGTQVRYSIAFATQPAGAALYFLDGTGNVPTTPSTYQHHFGDGRRYVVVFKKPGYLDCPRVLQIKADESNASQHWLEVNGGNRLRIYDATGGQPPPQVSCQLTPLPSTP